MGSGAGNFIKVILRNFDVLAGPVISLVYPLYASVRAIESKSPVDDQQWLTYWVLYSMITLFELTFAKLLEWGEHIFVNIVIIKLCVIIPRRVWASLTPGLTPDLEDEWWIPIWPYAKLIITCWLVLPYFSGAAYVYEHYVRPFFLNPQTVNIWYVPSKKDKLGKKEDILTAAEKYIQEHGTKEFENLIHRADKSRRDGDYYSAYHDETY